MDGICFDSEGMGPWSKAFEFEFTVCFVNLILANIPPLFLALFGLPALVHIIPKPAPSAPLAAPYFSKMFFLLLISVSVIVDAYLTKHSTILSPSALNITIILSILSTFLAVLLHHFEHLRSRISSSVLLFYWLIVFVVQAIKLQSDYVRNTMFDSVWYNDVLYTFLVLGIFGLELLPKPKHYYISLDEDLNACPEETANIFSRLTFYWMDPLMKLGYSKDLEMEDLWSLKKTDSAAFNSEKFQHSWSEQLSKKNPSFLWAIIRSYGWVFASAAIFKGGQDALAFLQPQLLHQLMDFVKSRSEGYVGVPQPNIRGFVIAIMMLTAAVVQTLLLHQYFHICLVTGMRVKSAIATAVYKKALSLSNSSRQQSTVGEIVNFMSVDALRISDLCGYLHIAWSGPFQIGLALYFLYQTLGAAIFSGVAVMIMTIPLNAWLAGKSKKLNTAQMKNKDSRGKLMDEFLNGIKVIKLYAWESPFLKKINVIRESELSTLKSIGYLSAAQSFTWSCTPFLVSFTSFALYSLFGDNEPLTSTKVFVSIALFNLLQFPLAVFPNVISALIEASVSFNRLHKFLTSEELDKEAVSFEPVTPTTSSTVSVERVVIENASFSWEKPGVEGSFMVCLSEIDVSCADGALLAIVGTVGSGKSSILSAILGEMYKISGQVHVRGSTAYIPQTAWIMNATLRENILFGKKYDAKFYDEVVTACGLRLDLEILPGGDLTEIGERGINLSGGQKQRVSIARAVYSRADIYLFDDPLSAVDAHVGKHIFDNVIGPKGVLANKARIFVTHAINYLPECDKLIMLKNGKIFESGTYNSLMKFESGTYLLMKEYGKRKQDDAEVEKDQVDVVASLEKRSSPPLRKSSLVKEKEDITSPKGQQLTQKEESAKGSVSWSVYKSYAESCSYTTVALYLIFAVASQMLSVGQNVFLSDWAASNDVKEIGHLEAFAVPPKSNPSQESAEITWRLSIYALLGVLYSISVIGGVIFVWVYCGIRSARFLHSGMLNNIVKLPQSFFDTTPLGRILNRFSKDQYTVDEILPRTFQGYFRCLFSVVSVLIVNSYSSPAFIAFAVPLGLLYVYFQRFYLSTSRELKRLDSTSRSPVYGHFQETLGGVSTIRAYKQEHRFINTNEDRIDYNQRASFPSISSNRWLAVRLEFIGSLVVFGSALFAVTSIFVNGSVSSRFASVVGLALTYALGVTQTLNWMVRMSCEIESQIIAVERIKEYIELPREAAHESDNHPDPSWPNKGVIEFRNYSTRYREGLELVLKNVSCTINSREKIGIVGRTGAGKSSLTLALFRLIEPASGTIVIDGIDIKILGLHDLRSRLTIIPQDPVLFAGSIRANLDPFGKHTDEEIWGSLKSSSLSAHVAQLDGKLDYIVHHGGENFSVGQRQLICLARALLRKTAILLLDEATAAIDVETDNIIQQTIRREFANCTILTIAHRINTVMDSDRILVLDQGKLVEFEKPSVLLKTKTSRFYSLAREAGLT